MTQDERNQRTRARIMSAARKEFGDNGYEAASINTICAAEGLSKGLLYHHFKDKDELYLTFFQQYPDEQKIFFRAMLAPPRNLAEELTKLRRPVEDFNRRILAAVLKDTELRPGITIEEVSDLELILQNYANSRPVMYDTALDDVAAHEMMCLQWIRLLLYGVVQTSPE